MYNFSESSHVTSEEKVKQLCEGERFIRKGWTHSLELVCNPVKLDRLSIKGGTR